MSVSWGRTRILSRRGTTPISEGGGVTATFANLLVSFEEEIGLCESHEVVVGGVLVGGGAFLRGFGWDLPSVVPPPH